MINSVILIPAYEPDEKLLHLLDALGKENFAGIVVVNDGSSPECAKIFNDIMTRPCVTLLHHSVNLGKGAALKLGFDYIYMKHPDVTSIITADSDGQHTPEDIVRLAMASLEKPNDLMLGARAFDKDVPFRSMFGNKLTVFLMRFLLGVRISDTQTGLRAIPYAFIPELLRIKYNRYEFELEMLLRAKRVNRSISEITITTVYIDNNSSSHFNPLLDSFKIYIVLFRYVLASFITALVDYAVFAPVLHFTGNRVLAVTLGRAAGATVQYILVRNVVFSSKEKVLSTLPKYIFLVICSGVASYLIMNSIEAGAHFSAYLSKLIAELLIYIANFLIQRDFIFQRSSPDDET